VLDPFMGSGSTLVAAARTGRRYVGYDLDPDYVEIARERVAAASEGTPGVDGPAVDPTTAGLAAPKWAEQVLDDAGFTVTDHNRRIRGTGTVVPLVAEDARGRRWHVEVAGGSTSHRGGMARSEVVWRTLGRAAVLRGCTDDDGRTVPLLVLTTEPPRRGSEGDAAVRAAGPEVVFDVLGLGDADDRARLAKYAAGDHAEQPLVGYWSEDDTARRGGAPR